MFFSEKSQIFCFMRIWSMYGRKCKYAIIPERITEIKLGARMYFQAWFLKLSYENDIFLINNFNV